MRVAGMLLIKVLLDKGLYLKLIHRCHVTYLQGFENLSIKRKLSSHLATLVQQPLETVYPLRFLSSSWYIGMLRHTDILRGGGRSVAV